MIRQVHLRNFKCFADQRIEFAPLTLLTGANATGKSTAIQALLLLRQAYLKGDLAQDVLRLNGELVSIGEAKDAIYSEASDDQMSFEILDDLLTSSLTFAFGYERGRPDSRILNASAIDRPGSALFADHFTYLSAERLGPRVTYPIAEETREMTSVGIHGEFTAFCLDEWGTEPIGLKALAMPSESDSVQLLHQTQLWMRFIAPDLQLAVHRMSEADTVRIEYRNHGQGNYHRPTNIGFGVSYTLPIIVAVLSSRPGNIVIIENPEAHLHPAAQSRIGRFLCNAAAAGLQVIVETHSDHVLNGIRLATKRHQIKPSDIAIQFFSRPEGENIHSVSELKMDADGRIDDWPDGFFDQSEKDLLELI